MCIRTGYSFKTAVGHLREVTSRLTELGWSAAPIADRGGTFGHVPWLKACSELRPVWGVELAVSEDYGSKKPSVDYWVFLARDRVADLNQLIQRATTTQMKEPVLTYRDAMDAPGVIKIAQEFTVPAHVDFSAPDLYMGLTPATPSGLYRAARDAGARFLAMPRNCYPRAADREFFRIILGRHQPSTQPYPMHITHDQELAERH